MTIRHRSARRFVSLAAAFALSAGVLPAAAEPAPDASVIAEGQDIAGEACAACHLVSPDQKAAATAATSGPAFATIADSPKASRDYLAPFIRTRHWDAAATPKGARDTYLTDSQVDAVASYILSLRKAP